MATRGDLPVLRSRDGWRRLRHRGLRALTALLVTVGVAVASFAVAPPAAANDNGPVSYEDADLRRALFTMHMRARLNGSDGLRDMMLSAHMAGYRQLNPQATAQQLIDQSVSVRNWYNSQLSDDDLERPAYQFVLKLLELSAAAPGGAVAAPVMRQLLETTVGAQLHNYGTMVDQITAAQFQYSWFQQSYESQNWIWQAVANLGTSDSTFRQAWNSVFGTKYNVDAGATIDTLAADPYMATWLNVGAILDNQQNNQQWLADTMAQLKELLGAINGRVEGYNEALRQFVERFPLANNVPTPSSAEHQAAVERANSAQQWINGASSAVEILSVLAGFASEDARRVVSGVGKAAIQIATAINQYLPAVAGLKLGAALTSMSTLALTGNVLGAISALLPVFSGGVTPEQQILDELRALREEVAELRTNMNDRFDRVERGLNAIYVDMMEQFGVIIRLQNATNVQLIQINAALAKVTERVDMWGHDLFIAAKTAEVSEMKRRINQVVGFETRNKLPLPYAGADVNYTTYAQNMVFDATDVARNSTFIAKTDEADPDTAFSKYGTYGSIGYLHEYAKGNNLNSGSTQNHMPADAEAWLLAASGYQMLLAQNPQFAARVGSAETDLVIAEGEKIQAAARDLSRAKKEPEGHYRHLNDLMQNAIMQYRVTAVEMERRATAILNGIRGTDRHNPFGGPDQPVPAGQKPTADPATVPSCTPGPGTAALSRPNVVKYAGEELANALWVAHWGKANSAVSLCHESGWTNVETRRSGLWEITRADLQFSFKVRQNWNGVQETVREWKQVIPLGEVCRVHENGLPGACRQAWQDVAKWDSTYKASFQPTEVDNRVAAKQRVTNWLNQQAGDYYTKVTRELNNPSPATEEETLYRLNKQLTTQAKLMTAYVKLGFGTAMAQDELISSNLVGHYRTPSDSDGLNQVTGAYEHARANYCLPGTNPCKLKPEGQINTSPLTGEQRLKCTRTAPLDPISHCLEHLTYERTDVMRYQLVFWSEKLAKDEYQEGLPAVDLALQSLRTADTIAQHTPVTP
ncbi:hypothetical protein [Micromonospora fluostatini]|uniref:hypothetical protein n=1 Tax=Micromonospora sp. JCM 30529 TaxID=3421643 RepID=UPI003D1843B4